MRASAGLGDLGEGRAGAAGMIPGGMVTYRGDLVTVHYEAVSLFINFLLVSLLAGL